MRRCASKDAGPQRWADCEIPHWLGEKNEIFFIKMWKPIPSSSKRTIFASGGLRLLHIVYAG